jgi:DNA-binding CsgD family transcriptional regulator
MSAPIKLSKRQIQLLDLLDKGMGNQAIATELDLSEHTVKVHLWRLYKRLGVNSRLEASRWARDNQPQKLTFALRAAFDAACRLHDQLKVDGGPIDTAEFAHHRAQVQQMIGAASC